jgi:hypothetical protein
MDFLCTTDAVTVIADGNGRPVRPTLCEVGYWLKPNDQLGELCELWRREDPLIDDDLVTGGQFQLVHDRVKTLEITYYRTLGSKAEAFYEWDASQRDELPRRIKIELTLERTLPNRNRVSGSEFDASEETLPKYTRHIVFDQRYPEILKPGVAMLPILPLPPQAAQEGPLGGGGGAGHQMVSTSEGSGFPQGGEMSVSRGSNTVQTVGGASPTPQGPQSPPRQPIDLGGLLRGGSSGGSGGGLFGSGGLFGGGR